MELVKFFALFWSVFGNFENSNHHRLQTVYDENVIIADSLLPRPKSASDGLYEPLVIGMKVVLS